MNEKKNNVRVLLTSSNGFVGHHICEHLLKTTDWDIVCIDRLSNPSNKGYDKLRDINVFDDSRIKLYQHDLNMPIGDGLAAEMGSFDYILHVAAASHVDNSISNPLPFVKNNVNSVLTMLEYSRSLVSKGLKKFLYFSTDEVYGTAPFGVDYAEGDRYNPGNPYSASKASAECLCYAYSNTYKVPIVITNAMNILGERQDGEKFLPKIINCVLDGVVLPIHSDPTKTQAGLRHYIHARNVASAIVFVLKETSELLDNIDSSLGKFHIVGEKEYDNLALAKLVASYVGKELKYEMVDFHSQRPGHDLRYSMSGDKLALLGWSVPVTIEESIKNIVDWSLKDENLHWLGK